MSSRDQYSFVMTLATAVPLTSITPSNDNVVDGRGLKSPSNSVTNKTTQKNVMKRLES